MSQEQCQEFKFVTDEEYLSLSLGNVWCLLVCHSYLASYSFSPVHVCRYAFYCQWRSQNEHIVHPGKYLSVFYLCVFGIELFSFVSFPSKDFGFNSNYHRSDKQGWGQDAVVILVYRGLPTHSPFASGASCEMFGLPGSLLEDDETWLLTRGSSISMYAKPVPSSTRHIYRGVSWTSYALVLAFLGKDVLTQHRGVFVYGTLRSSCLPMADYFSWYVSLSLCWNIPRIPSNQPCRGTCRCLPGKKVSAMVIWPLCVFHRWERKLPLAVFTIKTVVLGHRKVKTAGVSCRIIFLKG